MKTLQELYSEVMASDEMKKEFIEAFKAKEATEAVLKKYGCEASFEELQAFLKEKQEDDEVVSEEDVKAIAGGRSKLASAMANTGLSVIAPIGCAIKAGISAGKNLYNEEATIVDDIKCGV